MSERRACSLVAADHKMIRYRSRLPPMGSCGPVCAILPIRDVGSATDGCFIVLGNQGELSGVNRIYRLYREEGLTVRKRKAR
jgi:putative transposase